MANPTCPLCSGTGTDPKTQAACIPCGGDGTLDLLDPGFLEQQIEEMLDDSGYLVWAVLYAGVANEINEFSDIQTKLNALDTKLDALQDDMDIIKPQIQAVYDDLNL